MNKTKKNWPQHRDCEHFTRTALDWGECKKGRGKVCGTGKQCTEKRYGRKDVAMISATETTIKHNRAQMRGKPPSKDCYRANASYHEYMPDGHDFTGCYGLMDWPENVNAECLECGAYVHGGGFEKRVKEVMER